MRRIFLPSGLALALAGGIAWLHWRSEGYHFSAVEEGVLYRSGLLVEHGTPEEMTALLKRHGIRTVVNLIPATEHKSAEWHQREETAVKAAGARLVDMPVPGSSPPTGKQVDQFLRILREPASRPVLVHCRKGATRTGAMVAVYLIELKGMAPAKAARAVDLYGGIEDHGAVSEFIRTYKARGPASPP